MNDAERHFLAVEVQVTHDPGNPYVYRKCVVESECKQKDAVSHFAPDPAKLHELALCLSILQIRNPVEVKLTGRNLLCSFIYVRYLKTYPALQEPVKAGLGQRFRSRESKEFAASTAFVFIWDRVSVFFC